MNHTLEDQGVRYRQVHRESALLFRGTARVRLKTLHFPGDALSVINRKNVKRLKKIFAIEGCLRWKTENHVPAIIGADDLEKAIQQSMTTSEQLLNPPRGEYVELVFPADYRLECLHGRHRIQAAKESLWSENRWWTVDLYHQGK